MISNRTFMLICQKLSGGANAGIETGETRLGRYWFLDGFPIGLSEIHHDRRGYRIIAREWIVVIQTRPEGMMMRINRQRFFGNREAYESDLVEAMLRM